MRAPNLVKIFIVSSLIFCVSCGLWQKITNPAPSPTPFIAEELKSEIPFSTKEPEVFQAEIVVTNYFHGEKSEAVHFFARRGTQRLTVFNQGAAGETVVLQTAENKTFIIDKEKKNYRERAVSGQKTNGDDFLTTEWLNQKTEAKFAELGTENGLTKYRVQLADSESSEIIIFIDENLQIPVKQEFYSISGEQKTLLFSVEIRNFKPQADENLFQLPKDFQKATGREK